MFSDERVKINGFLPFCTAHSLKSFRDSSFLAESSAIQPCSSSALQGIPFSRSHCTTVAPVGLGFEAARCNADWPSKISDAYMSLGSFPIAFCIPGMEPNWAEWNRSAAGSSSGSLDVVVRVSGGNKRNIAYSMSAQKNMVAVCVKKK